MHNRCHENARLPAGPSKGLRARAYDQGGEVDDRRSEGGGALWSPRERQAKAHIGPASPVGPLPLRPRLRLGTLFVPGDLDQFNLIRREGDILEDHPAGADVEGNS